MIYTAHSISELPSEIKKVIRTLPLSVEMRQDWLISSETIIDNLDAFYYVEENNGVIDTFIVSNIIEKLDCSLFIGDESVVKQIVSRREVNPDFYKYKVLFIGAPMSMGPGAYLKSGILFQDVFDRFKEYVFNHKDIDGIFFTNSSVNNERIQSEYLMSFPYYPNTLLSLPFQNFEEHLNSRKKKKRWDIKKKKQIFSDKKCLIEIIPNSQILNTEYEKLFNLYQNTEKNNPDTVNYLHYSSNDKFRSLKSLGDDYKWIIVKQFDNIIAFALLVADGNVLNFKHVGLDYSVNRDTYSYFNLFYSAIKFAIENGFDFMQCGSTTYEVKLSLGCQVIDREATIIFNHKTNEKLMEFFKSFRFGGSKNE